MKQAAPARSARFLVRVLALACAGLAACGCASSGPEVNVTPLEGRQTYREAFRTAYSSRDSSGNMDIVLIDDAAAGVQSAGPVRQMMHVRVLWTPPRDQKAVATNAAITWYVLGRSNPQDVLAYSGAGFVTMDPDEGGTTTVQIHNALLKPSENHGTLRDPVGISRLEGRFVASDNPTRVARCLAELRGAVAAANPQERAIGQ